MRQIRKGKRGGKPRKRTEPLAEGIRKKRKQRNWKSMSDEELIRYAQGVVDEKGLKKRTEFHKADYGLYKVLRRRKLLDRIGFEMGQRDWASMGDDEIVRYAKRTIGEKELKRRSGLQKADSGLYMVLKRRKLLDRILPDIGKRRPRGFFSKMSDDKLIGYAQEEVKNKGIMGRSELSQADPGLYDVLRKRGLLYGIEFEQKIREVRDWASMSDDELIDYAEDFLKETEINGKSELEKADCGLYSVLLRRKLLDKIRFEKRRWSSMSDDEIISFSRQFLEERGITGRKELANIHMGLYTALIRRGLIDRTGLDDKRGRIRIWSSMSDEEMVEYAREVLSEKGLESRSALRKADSRLYVVLRKRKVLDRVFAPIESQQQKQAVQDVVDAMGEF